jgi:Zn finger protein HypA/HybF involved in hydrogenase expression
MPQKLTKKLLMALAFMALSFLISHGSILNLPLEKLSWQVQTRFHVQQPAQPQTETIQAEPVPPPPSSPEQEESTAPSGGEAEPIPITRDNLWSDMIWPLLQFLLLFVLMAVVPLMTFVVPVVVGFFVIRHLIRKYRVRCETCQVPMKALTGKAAKPYLDAGQIAEMEVDSMYHTVMICPQCNQRKVGHFVAANKLATECPSCHYKTLAVTDRQILTKPTRRSTGEAMVQRICRHCGYATAKMEVLGKRQRGMTERESSFVDENWTFQTYFSGFENEDADNPHHQ